MSEYSAVPDVELTLAYANAGATKKSEVSDGGIVT